jgi:hypothetical protein
MTNGALDCRRPPRRGRVLKRAQIVFKRSTATIDCALHDISTTGARLKVDSPIGIPNTFELAVAGAQIRHCRVVWRKTDQIGVEFAPNERQSVRPPESSSRTAARLKAGAIEKQIVNK